MGLTHSWHSSEHSRHSKTFIDGQKLSMVRYTSNTETLELNPGLPSSHVHLCKYSATDADLIFFNDGVRNREVCDDILYIFVTF